jgi:hypothetical protein
MNDQEKSEMGARTFVEFFQQFGDDVHAEILLEEILKGIMNEETLFVFGEPIEGRDQIDNDPTEQIFDNVENDESIGTEFTDRLGTSDISDYP